MHVATSCHCRVLISPISSSIVLYIAMLTGVFGSGWAWLGVTKDGKLEITTTPNQVKTHVCLFLTVAKGTNERTSFTLAALCFLGACMTSQ